MIVAYTGRLGEGMSLASFHSNSCNAPARSEARTEALQELQGFEVGFGSVFFQAGVVAPPEAAIFDSPAIFGDSV